MNTSTAYSYLHLTSLTLTLFQRAVASKGLPSRLIALMQSSEYLADKNIKRRILREILVMRQWGVDCHRPDMTDTMDDCRNLVEQYVPDDLSPAEAAEAILSHDIELLSAVSSGVCQKMDALMDSVEYRSAKSSNERLAMRIQKLSDLLGKRDDIDLLRARHAALPELEAH